jgi:hypothetical protein
MEELLLESIAFWKNFLGGVFKGHSGRNTYQPLATSVPAYDPRKVENKRPSGSVTLTDPWAS